MADKIEIGRRYVCRDPRYSVVVLPTVPPTSDMRLGLVLEAIVTGGDEPLTETFTRDGHFFHDGDESEYDFGPCLAESASEAAPVVETASPTLTGKLTGVPMDDRERLRITVAASLYASSHVPGRINNYRLAQCLEDADALLEAAKGRM